MIELKGKYNEAKIFTDVVDEANLVGVDIGCGMETIKIKEKHIELQKLDKLIYDKIPSGFHVREKTHRYFKKSILMICTAAAGICVRRAFCAIYS